MQQTNTKLMTALRVLTAVTKRSNPDPNDVQALQRLSPKYNGLPPDETARDVIHRLCGGASNQKSVKSAGFH
jgi:hypothetical protein